MVLVCPSCGGSKTSYNNVPNYNRYRRRLRFDKSLLCLTALLDSSSSKVADTLRAVAGLTSNVAHYHVSFVEGLGTPPSEELRIIFMNLSACPYLIVRGAYSAPTRKADTVLVCLKVEPLSPAVSAATKTLANHESCFLPQWPLHIALGITAKSSTYGALIRLTPYYESQLRVAPEHLVLLGTYMHKDNFQNEVDMTAFTLPTIVPRSRA